MLTDLTVQLYSIMIKQTCEYSIVEKFALDAGISAQVSVRKWLTLSCLLWCPWLSPCPDHSSAFLDSARTVRTWPTDWPWNPSRSRRSTAWLHARPCPGSSSADPSPGTTWSGAGFKLLNKNRYNSNSRSEMTRVSRMENRQTVEISSKECTINRIAPICPISGTAPKR